MLYILRQASSQKLGLKFCAKPGHNGGMRLRTETVLRAGSSGWDVEDPDKRSAVSCTPHVDADLVVAEHGLANVPHQPRA